MLLAWAAAFFLVCSPFHLQGQSIEQKLENVKKERETIQIRIKEIEKRINPILTTIAKNLYDLEPLEYRMLKLQAEKPDLAAQFFKKQNAYYENSLEGAAAYFDGAYEALRKDQLWFGREESLIKEDTAVFDKIQERILKELGKRDDAQELLDLIEERKGLIKKATSYGPVYDYLIERRGWWKQHPDYIKLFTE